MIFRVDVEMDVTFVDFQGKTPTNDPPIDSNGYDIPDIVVLTKNY